MGLVILLAEFFYFLLLSYFLLFVPGNLILSFVKHKFDFHSKIFLSLILGIISFDLLMYLLSWFRADFLAYFVYIAIFVFSYKKKFLTFPKIEISQKLPTVIVIVLSIIFSFQMIFNGNFGSTIYYFGDDMAHLGYISELSFGTMPYEQPAFAGIPFKGYHFFYDFLIAKLSTFTDIPRFSLYFHFIPLLVALLWGIGTYAFVYNWTRKTSAALWSVFFMLFGTTIGYFLYYSHSPNTFPNTNLGIDQPFTALLNAPYSLSVPIVIAVLLMMNIYLEKKNKLLLFLISLTAGVSFIFKVYSGMILVGGLGMFVLINLFKKDFLVLLSPIIAGTIAFLTFGQFIVVGSYLFVLPLWPLERIIDERFPEYGYMERLRTYSKQGVIHGIVNTYVFAFSWFLLGNLGTRLLGILVFPLMAFKKRKWPAPISLILLSMIVVSMGTALIFAQTIKVFEMIQITWYYPLFISLFAGVGLSYVFSLKFPKVLKIILALLIIAFTLPPILYSYQMRLTGYFTVPRESYNSDFFNAMRYLRKAGPYTQVVLELPISPTYTTLSGAQSWYHGASAHIPAFGEKRSFIGNQFIDFPNMPVDKRLKLIAKINTAELQTPTDKALKGEVINSLRKNNITYIYTTNKLHFLEGSNIYKIVYENSSSVIYKSSH